MSFGQRNLDREKPEIDFPEGDAPTSPRATPPPSWSLPT